jgi:CRP-like cAMP-binding protein
LVSRALRFAPTSPDIAAALLDLIADGLDRDDQPRADRADLKALEAVAHYVRRLGG